MGDSPDDLRRAARNARDRTRRAHDRERLTRQERARRDARKRAMIASRGGACARCKRTVEEIGHVAAFDFHHVDPRSKRCNINRMYYLREELRAQELAKCIVLCATCHRVVEATAAEETESGAGGAVPSLAAMKRPQGRPPLGSEHALRIASERMADAIRRAEAIAHRRAEEKRRREAAWREMPPLF
jgi:hypothetical protein